MLVVALLRMGELEEFDLLKLVLTQDSTRVLAGSTRFRAEAGGPRGYVDREALGGNGFVEIKIVELHFAGGRQPEIGVLNLEEIGGKFWQLAGRQQRGAVHEEGRKDFRVPVLACVHIEEEIRQGAFEPRTPTFVNGEASSGNFCSCLQIENPGALTHFPMRLRREVEFRRGAPPPNFHIVLGAVPDRDTRVRKIRNRE